MDSRRGFDVAKLVFRAAGLVLIVVGVATDPRFYRTPYIRQQGWVSFKLQGRIPWTRLRELLREAHMLAA
jgi:hypothetical protein